MIPSAKLLSSNILRYSFLNVGTIDVDCDCSKPTPPTKTGEPAPVCVETKDASGTDCVPLVLATEQETEVGSVCLKVVGHDKPVLELTYHSTDYYSLIQNHFWVGLGDIQELPSLADGSPDVDLFPYYWCDYAGDDQWRTPIPAINLTLACQSENRINFVAVAHSSVEEAVYEDGHFVEGARHSAFAFEYGEDSAAWFGWFNFTIDCDCHLEPTPAPSTSTSPSALPSYSPTTSPEPSASALPTTSPAPSTSASPSSEPTGELDEWFPCYHVWAYHPVAAIPFTDIGVAESVGWTNGHFDLYGCGTCECPTCSSGKPLCDEIFDPVVPEDPCTCVCPGESFVQPTESGGSMVKASIPAPIVMELYADSTAKGVPLGRSFGNVTITFSDNVASIVYNVADVSTFYSKESHASFRT